MPNAAVNEEDAPETERLSTLIDADLKKRFKLACVQKSVTMTEVLELLISEWLGDDD